MSRIARVSRRPALAVLFAFLAVFSGCAGGHGGSSGGSLGLILLSDNVTAGVSVQLQAMETTRAGVRSNVTTSATYSSGNPMVATVNSAGLLTALNAGTVVITATLGKSTGSLTVTVGDPLVTGLSVTPTGASVVAGDQQQYTATVTYANHTTSQVSNSAIWSVNPASVATISSTGLLTAVSAGGYVVTATFGSESATQNGTVTPNTLSSISISPATSNVAAGATQQFAATGTYANGGTTDITSTVAWTSSDPAHLSISNAGLATAANSSAPETVQISATLNGVTASVPVTLAAGSAMTALVIEPTSSSIARNSAEQHTATAFFADGSQKDVSNSVTWNSSNEPTQNGHAISRSASLSPRAKAAGSAASVVSVSSTGIDTAVTPGMATIQASLGGLSASSVVIVTPATVASLTINSPKQLFPVGSQQAITLTGIFSDGSTQDLSLTASWQSSDVAVATIDATGKVTALSAGPVVFSASFGGLTVLTTGFNILSSPLVATTLAAKFPANHIGLVQPLQVIGTYADGSTHDITSLATFKSADPSIFAVDAAGNAVGLVQGTTQITATVGGLSAIAEFSTFTNPLLAVQVLPATAKIAIGTHFPFSATAQAADGLILNVSDPSVWTSADPTVLTIGGDGVAKAGGLGTTTVSAQVLGVTGFAQTVEVTDATLKSILLVRNGLVVTDRVIAAGTSEQYQAIGIFSDDSIQDITSDVAWRSSDNDIASLDLDGTALGNKPGQVQVTASLEGITATTTLNVSGATLVSTALTPGQPELPVGIYRQFSLIGSFSDGTTQDLTADAIFQAPTPAIVSVVPQGLVLGGAAGVGQITAQRGYFSASTPVIVTGATLTGLTLDPSSASIRLGGQQQFTATGTFSDGYTQNLVNSVLFSSSAQQVASTANQLGNVVGVGIGSATVSASLRGLTSSTANFTVLSDTLSSITFSPANPSLVAGTNQQFTATGTYTDGTTDDLTRTVAWSSSNPAVLSVSASGLATAYAVAGPTTVTVSVQSTNFASIVTNASFQVTINPAPPTQTGVTLLSIAVSPTSAHLAIGTQQQLTATATLSDGTTHNYNSSTTWSSSNPLIASVSNSGLVTASAVGSVTINAQVGTLTSASTIAVSAAVLTSIAISPSGVSLVAGAPQQLSLTGSYSDGTEQNLTSLATWSSSNPAIASIDEKGLALGISPGSVSFTATYGVLSTTSALSRVSPATLVSIAVSPNNVSFAKGTTQQFTVIGTYSDGSTRNVTGQSTYASSNNAVLNIDSSGVATGVGVGPASITVNVSGFSTTTLSVNVTPATLTSITITPNNPSLASGTSQQFTATGIYSDGSTQNLSNQVVWTSSVPTVVAIDANGYATSSGTGSASITATFQGTSTTSGMVTVTPALLVGLTLTPTSAQIAKGTTQQFNATGTFTDGTTQNLTSEMNWSTSDGTVASVDEDGLATGNATGSAQIKASYNGRSASTSSFLVTAATLVSISFSPAKPTVAAGTATQLQVIGTYSDGTTQDLSSSSVFSSSNPQVATIDASGVIRGVAPGDATLTITAGGQTNTLSLTVSNAVLTGITITPNPPAALAKGSKEQFVATASYSDGTTQTITNTTSWTSSDVAVLTVDQNGLATGTGTGSAQLTATSNGQSATTSSLSVTPAIVTSITVTPQNGSLPAGSTLQLTAIATSSDGTTIDVTGTAQWSSADAGLATVSTAGVLTGISAGTTIVSAQYSGQSGQTTVTVTSSANNPATLQQIVVTPANSSANVRRLRSAGIHSQGSPMGTLVAGQTEQFVATGIYSDQSSADLTTQVTWSSTNPNVATINSSGLASAVSAGSTSLQAALNNITGASTLTVTSAPVLLKAIAITPSAANVAQAGTQQFTASGSYSDGSTLDLTGTVTWTSASPTIATIGGMTGLANGLSAGNTVISASLNSIVSVATITVSPATLVSLTVTPQTASVASGTAQQYKAIGTLSDGSTQDLTSSVTWTSSNTAEATVTATGLARTAATGNVTVTASAGASSASAALTITTATATSLQLTPGRLALPAGGIQQLLATANFTDGSSQDVSSSVLYSSSNVGIATVNAAGKVQALHQGTTTITGSLGSAAASVQVTVGSAVLSSLAVTPANLQLAAGMSQQFTATGSYSDGSTQDLTSAVTWSSSDPMNISVSASGNVIALHAVSATISALFGSTSASTVVSGTAAVATNISVSPATQTLAVGTSQQFAATANLSDGTQQNVTASAHWSVSDPAKATISNSTGSAGLLTANAAGALNVTATVASGSSSVSGQGSVTLTAAVLTGLTINPGAIITAPAGTLQQLSVTGNYSDGSSADVSSLITWSTGQASTAFVDSSAVLHAVLAGITTINATLGAVTGTSVVNVSGAVLVSIAVTPASPALALGQTAQLTATGTYSDGTTLNVSSQVQWTSSAAAVATISGTGVATTRGTGSSTLTATLNGVAGSTSLVVSNATLTSIVIQANQTSFALGTSLQLQAIGYFSNGATQNLTNTVQWFSQEAAKGLISSTGLATGVSTGTFTVAATNNGVTGTTSLTVTAATLVSIAVTTSNANILNIAGSTVQFYATGTFSDGSTENLTSFVHWTTTGIVLGTINQAGIFSPTGIGVGTVTATSGTTKGSLAFTVVSVPLF